MIERINKVIDYLKATREILSQAEFADKLSMNPSQISEMLSGKRPISERTINKIALSFPSLCNEWLLTGKGDMLKNSQKIGDITGSNNTAVAGNGNHVNSETDKFLDLLKTQTEIIQKNSEMLQKRDAQIDELIALLKK